MASRVLSIEINQMVTKICEMEEKAKAPRVYKSFLFDNPEEIVADGVLKLNDGYISALKKALAANKVKAKRVVFSITSSRIASREILIPYVKANKVEEVINAKAEEYFPVDLAEYKVTYSLLGEVTDDKGTKRHKVLVLAAPLKLLQGYYDLAAACGMEIKALDYMGNSLFQAVKNTCISGTQLVAKIDEHSTLLLIIQDGALLTIRSVPYGVEEAVNIVSDEGFLDETKDGVYGHESAIHSLRENLYIQHDVQEAQAQATVERAVTEALEYLVNGIGRVIDFYNPKSNGHPIEKMYLTGLGGSFRGMGELMEERLGVRVSVIRDVDGLVVPKSFDALSLGDYIACIGAAMAPLDLLISTKKGKKQKEKASAGQKGDSTGVAILVGTGGVAVACVLAVMAMVPYKQAETENRRLLNRIEELKPTETVHNTYIAAQDLWTDADNMYELTNNHNQDLVAFIQELEQKMPSDIIVLSMVASADDVTLNVNVSSKAAAAKVVRELSAFETIEVVQTSGLSDVKGAENVHVVSFSVSCVYTNEQAAVQ